MTICRFCATLDPEKVLDPETVDLEKAFESVSVPTLDKFLEWTICQKVGKNGRKKRGTKTSGALFTRWKNLQIVYKVAMRKKFEARIYDDMHEVDLPSLEALVSRADCCRLCNA